VILPSGRALNFVFDGTFWIWDDDSQCLGPAQTEQSLAVIRAAEPTDHADHWPMAATISHSGAVHEFLMLHFRLGHLNYTAMLRAPQAGTWTGFQELVALAGVRSSERGAITMAVGGQEALACKPIIVVVNKQYGRTIIYA
jgi:hypothetical protein